MLRRVVDEFPDDVLPQVGCLLVGAVTAPPGTSRAAHRVVDLVDVEEPLALRLALLRFAYDAPATLSTARLRRADETLHRWRVKMADWAHLPVDQAPPRAMGAIRRALVTDLDTAAVLTTLGRIESDLRLPSGAKHAAFTAADRVLGLDLDRITLRRLKGR